MLWLENFANYKKQQIITFFITLLWGMYCFFMLDEKLNTYRQVELIAIGLAVYLSVFFISFLKKENDNAYWNFSIQIPIQYCLAICFGSIIFSGLSLANYAVIELLFKTEFLEDMYFYLAIICYVLFTSLYFLANIPDKIAKQSEEISLSKHLKVLAYILVPIAAIYTVILYIYLFKIIFTWELPNGFVSYLVSAHAFVGLFIITLLYPARMEGNKFVVFISRYFSLIILPLLTLMTIGIVRRINDYGITINRCYVLLLNIWFYGIYIYLFISKIKRIKWIAISPAVLVLFASVGFWSIPNITKHILTAELNELLDNKKITLGDFKSLSFEDEEIEEIEKYSKIKKIKDKLKYLNDTYGRENIWQFFSEEVNEININSFVAYYKAKDKEYISYSVRKKFINEVQNISDFDTFAPIKYNSSKSDNRGIYCYYKEEQLIIEFTPDNRIFSIPLPKEELRKDKSEYIENNNGVLQYDDYIVLFESITGNYHLLKDSISIRTFEGYLFYRR
ncbi:MAG: DUF4153 domain-containing protein [Fibromonadaceae bacterium]|nr:DUF4153 domain-containing protein [Fibromonadaceae bacterium]